MAADIATPSRSTRGVDEACADAVELAQQAAAEAAGRDGVGEYLGAQSEGDRLVTHRFACHHAGYRGWHWAVTVTRAARAKAPTVAEVVLLPGEGALLAPGWVPWSERLRPEDLGPGDLLPTTPDDDRLVPTYASGDDPAEEQVAYELGLGRVRVLSPEGRGDALERWAALRGAAAPMAKASPAPCGTCGFYVPLRGSLGLAGGICANEYSPADGLAVLADYGCGAHSEVLVDVPSPVAEPSGVLVDDDRYDAL